MSAWSDFTKAVTTGAASLADTLWNQYETEAKADALAFVNQSKIDLLHWADQVAKGQIDADDLASNIRALGDVGELRTLALKVQAEEQLQRFWDGFVDLVIDAAGKLA